MPPIAAALATCDKPNRWCEVSIASLHISKVPKKKAKRRGNRRCTAPVPVFAIAIVGATKPNVDAIEADAKRSEKVRTADLFSLTPNTPFFKASYDAKNTATDGTVSASTGNREPRNALAANNLFAVATYVVVPAAMPANRPARKFTDAEDSQKSADGEAVSVFSNGVQLLCASSPISKVGRVAWLNGCDARNGVRTDTSSSRGTSQI